MTEHGEQHNNVIHEQVQQEGAVHGAEVQLQRVHRLVESCLLCCAIFKLKRRQVKQ